MDAFPADSDGNVEYDENGRDDERSADDDDDGVDGGRNTDDRANDADEEDGVVKPPPPYADDGVADCAGWEWAGNGCGMYTAEADACRRSAGVEGAKDEGGP